jgi:hypothetical protein
MNWSEIRTLQELETVHPRLAQGLTGTSLEFHEPPCAHVHWEVERKPWHNDTLVFRPSMDVSRAWDLIFRIALSFVLSPRMVRYRVSDQADPPDLFVEVSDDDQDQARRVLDAVKAVTVVANSVSSEAATTTRREHKQLAQDLGLSSREIGFRPA